MNTHAKANVKLSFHRIERREDDEAVQERLKYEIVEEGERGGRGQSRDEPENLCVRWQLGGHDDHGRA